jgi:L-threonylcarbamoyladenylate synthase
MKTQLLSLDALKTAQKIINNGGVIAFPTETVFGLGVRYDSFLGCQKLDKLKSRDGVKQYTLMLYDKKDIGKYATLSETGQKLIDAFLPGPITLILKANSQVVDLTKEDKTIGIRIPDHPFALELLATIEAPLFVTSANISGEKPLVRARDVVEQFDNKIEAIFNQDAEGESASTIVEVVDDGFEVLREGKITIKDIEGVLNDE